MANAALNHRILPQRFISQSPPRVSHSINLKLLEARRQFHPLFPPLLFTHTNLPCRRRRRSSGVASCLHSSSSSSPPRTGLNSSTRLFVSGLSFRTTEESLRNAFEKFGEIVEVNLVMDKIANRPRGFAFLGYATEEESKKAIEGMHGKDEMKPPVSTTRCELSSARSGLEKSSFLSTLSSSESWE